MGERNSKYEDPPEKPRAQRLADNERIKHNRSNYWGGTAGGDDKRTGKALHTPSMCSCYMCGNPRKHFGESTIQEKRQLLSAKSGLDELSAPDNFMDAED